MTCEDLTEIVTDPRVGDPICWRWTPVKLRYVTQIVAGRIFVTGYDPSFPFEAYRTLPALLLEMWRANPDNKFIEDTP